MFLVLLKILNNIKIKLMKIVTITILALLGSNVFGQKVVFTSGEDKENVISVIPKANSIDDDEFDLYCHLICSNERQKEIDEDFDDIKAVITVNGVTIDDEKDWLFEADITFSYQAESDETFYTLPSIQSEIPLDNIIKGLGNIMTETGNICSINFMFKGESLGVGSVQFNIPQFSDPNGDFCNLRLPFKSNTEDGIEEVIKAVSKDFITKNPNCQITKIWIPYAKSVDEDGVEEFTAVMLYSQNGIFNKMVIKAERKKGEIFVNEDKYSSIIQNIHPDCIKSFLAKF